MIGMLTANIYIYVIPYLQWVFRQTFLNSIDQDQMWQMYSAASDQGQHSLPLNQQYFSMKMDLLKF